MTMTTTCKCTITRPSLDSLFVFEWANFGLTTYSHIPTIVDKDVRQALHATSYTIQSKLFLTSPKIILHRYEEFITWNEIIERKHELRPDLRYIIEQSEGKFEDQSNIYGEGPSFNPFSLTHTRNATYETFEDWKLNYDSFSVNERKEDRLNRLKIVSNTLEEKLYIDGILIEYPDFAYVY